MSKIRKFNSGAVRDTSDGKLEYFGFQHPLVEFCFAEYMNKHRKMADGSLRSSNNWWKGFGTDVIIQSLTRHIEDLKLLHAGFYVYEKRENNKAERVVLTKKIKKLPKNYTEITFEECLCAIKFNSSAYLLEILKKDGKY